MEAVWFTALFSSICLEGLGRRYLPGVPSLTFYFLKDVVLLFGYVAFRPSRAVTQTVRMLYGGFGIAVIAGLVWTVIDAFNPTQTSGLLAALGVRSYWLWWIAPAIIAQVISKQRTKRHAIYVFVVMSIGIAFLAVLQFLAPPSSSLNMYTVIDGEGVYSADVATVSSTGRARVASTFSFITGFQDFTVLVPTILLAVGLDAQEGRLRNAAFLGTLVTAAVLPMSGSRSSVVLGAAVLIIAAWTSGLLFTRAGRRIMIGGVLAAVVSVSVFPEAFLGVQSRFGDDDETQGRVEQALETYVPPLAIARVDAPLIGIGTGTQQNAHTSMRVALDWNAENETDRYLVELGPVGFLLVWVAKLGLVISLFRASSRLKKAGRRGAAAAATSYAVLTFSGNLTFDHVWQALYFVGCGFILAEVVSSTAPTTATAAVTSAPLGTATRLAAAADGAPGAV